MTADNLRCLDEAGYLVLPARLANCSEILSYLETRFEQAGENAGHVLRAEPFARSVDIALPDADPDVPRLFAPLTTDLTALECVGHLLGGQSELTTLRAHSCNPFALAPSPPRPGPGARTCRVLWLLDDFTEPGTAALRVVPCSHRLERMPAMPHANLPAECVTAPAGSAIILNGRLWAGAAANAGNRHMRALRCEYVRRAARNSG